MYKIGGTRWIGKGMLLALLLTLNPAAQVEISANSRFGSARSTFKRSANIQPIPTGANSLHYEVSEKRRQTAIELGLSQPTSTVPGRNASKVLQKTEHGSQLVSIETYLETLKESLKEKIEGVPGPQLRNLPDKLDQLSACTESDQLSPTFYDRREYICCEGLHNRSAASDICCEKQVVSSDDVFCCDDKIYRKSETNHTACCGDSLYDPDTEICCGSTLYPRGDNTQCCGMRAYDTRSQVCCFGLSVFEMWQGDQCCGMAVYHSINQTCCIGVVQPAYGKHNSRGRCCDTKSYDGRCFTCDDEGKIPVPLFDVNKRICCDGKTRRREWPITQCCGRLAMDGTNSECVNNTVRTRTVSTDRRMYLFAEDALPLPQNRNNVTGGHVPVDIPVPVEKPESPQWNLAVYILVSCSGVAVIVSVTGFGTWYVIKKRRKHALSDERQPLNYDSLNNANVCYSCENTEVSVPSDPKITNINRIYWRSNSDLSTKSRVSCHSMPITIPMETICDEDEEYPTKLAKLCYQNELSKTNDYNDQNVYDNLVSDFGTQTMETKPCNLLNTFGKPFAHKYMVDSKCPTLQMPESDEKMTLPAKLLDGGNPVETHCCSYWEVDDIRRKFKLMPADECVASPAVEYHLTGYRELPDYAVVVKPFIGNPEKLRVYKFASDQGAHPVGELIPVPRKDKLNDDMDMFYVIEGNLVYIYTKSFSGFLCTTCKHSRNLKLTAYLYGSYKKFAHTQRDKYEVRLKVYIADELLTIRDFRQGMEEMENVAKRTLLAQQPLNLNDVTRPDDELEIEAHPSEENDDDPAWMHKRHPVRDRPIYSPSETVQLKDIAEQCQDCPNMHMERSIPWSREWYLVNRDGRIPPATFQCLMEITCIAVCHEADENNVAQPPMTQRVAGKETTIIVDDLTLPEGTHVHRNPGVGRIVELKNFLRALGGEKKIKLMDEIRKRQRDVVGDTIDKMVDYMGEKIGPQDVPQVIYLAMDVCHMKDEIKQLQHLGLIVDDHIERPTQRIESHRAQEVQGACQKFETMSLQMNNVERRNGFANGRVPDTQLQAQRSASESNMLVRREISQTLTSSVSGPPGYLNSQPGVGPEGYMRTQPVRARPEVGQDDQTFGQAFGLGSPAERTPVQEHASMDETEPLKVATSKETL